MARAFYFCGHKCYNSFDKFGGKYDFRHNKSSDPWNY